MIIILYLAMATITVAGFFGVFILIGYLTNNELWIGVPYIIVLVGLIVFITIGSCKAPISQHKNCNCGCNCSIETSSVEK